MSKLNEYLQEKVKESKQGALAPEAVISSDKKSKHVRAEAKDEEWVSQPQEELSPQSKVVQDVSLTKEKQMKEEQEAAAKLEAMAIKRQAAPPAKTKPKGGIEFSGVPAFYSNKQKDFPTLAEAEKMPSPPPDPVKPHSEEPKKFEEDKKGFVMYGGFTNTKKKTEGPSFGKIEVVKEKEYQVSEPSIPHKIKSEPEIQEREFEVAGSGKPSRDKAKPRYEMAYTKDAGKTKESGKSYSGKKQGSKPKPKDQEKASEEGKKKGTGKAVVEFSAASYSGPAWSPDALK